MEKSYFSLEIRDNNRLTRFFQSFLGLICIAIALFWLFYNFETIETDWTLWITVIFLLGFGIFQIISDFGYAERFIEIGPDRIRLKQNSVLPVTIMELKNIERVEVFPLKVVFNLKGRGKILFRLGLTEPEKADRIKDSLIKFTGETSIPLEIRNEG